MSILEDPYALAATASLVIQIVVLFLLIYGYSFKRKMKFRLHGMTMAVAVVLHLVMIFVIMIPSFVLAVFPEFIVPAPLQYVSLVGLIHGITGSIAIVLGIGLVGVWHFSKDVTGCFKRKNIMRATLTVWIITLVLGIALYAYFYGPILTS